jgi:hypothetical protein
MTTCKFSTVVNQGQTLGMAEADAEMCVEFVPKCPQA